jgi:hypothetical protein
MVTYFLQVVSTYVFTAESDEEALYLVEEGFEEYIEEGKESEELSLLIKVDGDVTTTVKDYR